MKYLKITNLIAILTPIILLLVGVINEGFIIYSAMSLTITGFLQVVVGICYLILNPKSKSVLTYLFSVLFYFIAIYLGNNLFHEYVNIAFCIGTPFFLCIYLTIILYSKNELYNRKLA